jgi:hypothetical protein
MDSVETMQAEKVLPHKLVTSSSLLKAFIIGANRAQEEDTSA